jgi:hypothetical protein
MTNARPRILVALAAVFTVSKVTCNLEDQSRNNGVRARKIVPLAQQRSI